MRLTRGRISTPADEDVFDSDWLTTFFKPTFEGLHREFEALHAKDPKIWPEMQPWPFWAMMMLTVKRLLYEIQSFGHGGSVLLLPQDDVDLRGQATQILEVRYKTAPLKRSPSLFSSVHSIFSSAAQPGLDRTGEKRVEFLKEPLDRRKVVRDFYRWRQPDTAELFRWFDARLKWTASLSQIDGTLLLNRKLDVIGFGVVIEGVRDSEVKVRQVGEAGASLSPHTFGTRHRAIFKACHLLRGAIGIVASQDGGLKFVEGTSDGAEFRDHEPGPLEP